MTLSIPEVLGVLGLALTIVMFVWRRLGATREDIYKKLDASRRENREAHEAIAARIDRLRDHLDQRFDALARSDQRS